MNHQDWDVLVLKKPYTLTTNKVLRPTKTPDTVREESDGAIVFRHVTREMATAVMRARTTQKLTQAQLAQRASLPHKTITEIEKGGGMYRADEFNRLARALRVNLPRS
jgi:ribosome-binding protein aMBF1 (putative translation factor)